MEGNRFERFESTHSPERADVEVENPQTSTRIWLCEQCKSVGTFEIDRGEDNSVKIHRAARDSHMAIRPTCTYRTISLRVIEEMDPAYGLLRGLPGWAVASVVAYIRQDPT